MTIKRVVIPVAGLGTRFLPASNLAIGRYILNPSIFKHLKNLEKGSGSEHQLTDALKQSLHHESMEVVKLHGATLRYRQSLRIHAGSLGNRNTTR
ncbi:hypothetical protein MUN89_07790 [Halobacillus salinarum]|uniref:UTP--glucose-1-phosphate uridylyltransferase n=1 Tax=Halobacillus salinarum TaxID=2932257 RepID=A0ABY4EMY5_9BACI|nr:hypothetical protein [Halobacillus salinarum]UOQ45820.1 hypothetical protein MUN89_07790 [Halobacillus salinarum]